jgi:hypothetical protein
VNVKLLIAIVLLLVAGGIAAFQFIGGSGAPNVAGESVDQLLDRFETVQSKAELDAVCVALGNKGTAMVDSVIARYEASAPDSMIRRNAMKIFTELGPRDGVEALKKLLKVEKSPEERAIIEGQIRVISNPAEP